MNDDINRRLDALAASISDLATAADRRDRAADARHKELMQLVQTTVIARIERVENAQKRGDRRTDVIEETVKDLVIAVHALETGAPKPKVKRGKK